MRLSTLFKLLAAVLVLATVAVIAASKALNSASYNAFLAERIKAASGLDASFDGATKLKLGLSPRISFTGVSLSAGKGAPLLYIDRIEAPLALPALVLRQLRVESAVLFRPTLNADSLGRPEMLRALDLFGDAPAGAPATRLSLGEIRIEDGTIRGHGETIAIPKALIVPEGGLGGPLAIQAEARLHGHPMTIAATLPPFSALTAGRPYPIQGKIALAGANLTLRGSLGDDSSRKGLDLDIRAQGDDFAEPLRLLGAKNALNLHGPFKIAARLSDTGGSLGLQELDGVIGRKETLLIGLKGRMADLGAAAGVDLAVTAEAEQLSEVAAPLGLPLPTLGPLKISGRLTDHAGGWKLSGIKGTLGRGEVGGDLAFQSVPRPHLGGRLSLGRLTLDDVSLPRRAAGEPDRSAQPQRAAIPIDDGRILSVALLSLGLLDSAEIDLNLRIARLDFGPLRLAEASGTVRMGGGRLSIDDFAALAGKGPLGGSLRLDTAGKAPVVVLSLNGSGLDPAPLSGEAVKGAPLDLNLDLRAQGASPRAMAGSAEGSLSLTLGETQWSPGWAGEILTRLARESDVTAVGPEGVSLRCAALRIPLRAGLLNLDRGAGFETTRGGALAYGTIDLRSEAVDLAVAFRGAPPVRVKGMLGAPQVVSEGGIRAQPDAAPCRTVQARRLTR